jgi:siroheme synthase (precorrin-2 oxidase/ferrochelatase)
VVSADLEEAERSRRVVIVRESYRKQQLERATLVIAATDSREVNAQIAVDANASSKLVNITDYPDEGNFHTMALHRSGDITIAVSSGGVPGAAARIRDAIAERFDARYQRAVSVLRGLRSASMARGDDSRRNAADKLLGEDCDPSRTARSARRWIRGVDRRRREPHHGPNRVREKRAFRPWEALQALGRLRENRFIREGVVLSTCNRTEIYAVEESNSAAAHISGLLSDRLGDDVAEFEYVRRDRDATSHLFAVAAGLDSMILGEAQIQGQVKSAWEECRAESGPILNRMFQSALLAASRAREETGIGRGAASSARRRCSWRRRFLADSAAGARWYSARATSQSSPSSVFYPRKCASQSSPTGPTSARIHWRSGTGQPRCITTSAGSRCAMWTC